MGALRALADRGCRYGLAAGRGSRSTESAGTGQIWRAPELLGDHFNRVRHNRVVDGCCLLRAISTSVWIVQFPLTIDGGVGLAVRMGRAGGNYRHFRRGEKVRARL